MKVVLKRHRRVRLPRPANADSNVRLLENGDERITESGDTRTLE